MWFVNIFLQHAAVCVSINWWYIWPFYTRSSSIVQPPVKRFFGLLRTHQTEQLADQLTWHQTQLGFVYSADADGGRGRGRRTRTRTLCIRRTLCRHVTFLLFDYFWRLVHCWYTAFVSFDICNVARVSCNVAGVPCNVAGVSCNVARVSCNVARVFCNVAGVSCNLARVFCNVAVSTCFL